MGFLSSYDGTEDVDLSDLVGAEHNTWIVTVRKSLTSKQMYKARQHLGRVVNGKASPDIAAYQMEMVIAAVVDWNLTDSDDHDMLLFPPERKRESILNLPDKVFTRIQNRVQELNRERSGEEEDTFLGGISEFPDDGQDAESANNSVLVALPDLGEDGTDA